MSAQRLEEQRLDELARAVVDCWNRSDWSAYRALSGPRFVYEEVGSGRRVEDVDELLMGWQRLRAAFPDASAEVVDVLVRGDVTVAGLVWRATHTGLVLTADGIESPSYKKLQVADVISTRWRDEHIVSERHNLGFMSVVAPVLEVTSARDIGRF
jgi:predicted ester cyclase